MKKLTVGLGAVGGVGAAAQRAARILALAARAAAPLQALGRVARRARATLEQTEDNVGHHPWKFHYRLYALRTLRRVAWQARTALPQDMEDQFVSNQWWRFDEHDVSDALGALGRVAERARAALRRTKDNKVNRGTSRTEAGIELSSGPTHGARATLQQEMEDQAVNDQRQRLHHEPRVPGALKRCCKAAHAIKPIISRQEGQAASRLDRKHFVPWAMVAEQ